MFVCEEYKDVIILIVAKNVSWERLFDDYNLTAGKPTISFISVSSDWSLVISWSVSFLPKVFGEFLSLYFLGWALHSPEILNKFRTTFERGGVSNLFSNQAC